jgi:hypothetical protein
MASLFASRRVVFDLRLAAGACGCAALVLAGLQRGFSATSR